MRRCLVISLLLCYLFAIANCLDVSNGTEGNSLSFPPDPPTAPDESYSLKKLRQELLATRQYDRMSRPVKNHLTQTKVDMRITVNEFVELDTVNSMLVTDAWFHITWRDELLTWDPNDFQQLKQIHMNPAEIWKPDIVLINTADQDNIVNVFSESEVLVNSTGDVLWITMGLLRSKCPVWAYDYPFAIRPVTCRLTFCSLIYQSHEVNITTPGNEFYLAGPWLVNPRLQYINATGERYERFYDGYGTYSFESLSVQLKRRDNVLPLLIRIPTLTAIIMTLCMFFLPINWPVRIHLAIFAALIQIMLMLYIGLQLGVNAIGLARPISYLRDDLFLTSLALALTLLFRRLLALADWLPAVPYALSALLAGPLSRLLCFGINSHDYATNKPAGLANKSANKPFAPAASRSGSNLASRAFGGGGSRNFGSRLASDHVSLVEEQDSEEPVSAAAESDLKRGSSTTLDMSQLNGSAHEFEQIIHLSGGQFEWMQMIIFCDRLLFVFYALIMIPRLI